MKKVIGFSLWGDEPHYYEGAIKNIELAEEYYPGWETWFYIQDNDNPQLEGWIKPLLQMATKVIFYQTKFPFEGLVKRFLPIIEKDVEIFISRDCDSRINSREQSAVNQWLNETQYPFHIMRDHRDHQTEILGGMWGCKTEVLRQLQSMLDKWTDYSKKGVDQEFLTKFVWPIIKNNHIAHDTYDYTKWPMTDYAWKSFGDKRPFPAHAPMKHGTFVGEQFQ